MLEEIPIINWFEEPIKQSIQSIFNDTNNYVESLDVFKKYRKAHFEMLIPSVKSVKILGML